MICPACGRKMSVMGSFAACTNILCDYEEEIRHWEVSVGTELKAPQIVFECAFETPDSQKL
jgi:hypothetical protein